MLICAPLASPSYEVDWVVPDGALVDAGVVLAWLSPVGECELVPLTAQGAGLVARRTSLLPVAAPGALLAVVGGEVAALRAEERALLADRMDAVAAELASIRNRSDRPGAAHALLADEERRLEAWLAEARAAHGP